MVEPKDFAFIDYQSLSLAYVSYPGAGDNFVYPTLGLTGEAGEVADKIKKVIRDDHGVITPESRKAISLELGDVLWYLSQLATELGLDLDTIALDNLDKLESRKQRGKLQGSGDQR